MRTLVLLLHPKADITVAHGSAVFKSVMGTAAVSFPPLNKTASCLISLNRCDNGAKSYDKTTSG